MVRYRVKGGRVQVDSQILHGNEREKYGVTITVTNGSAYKSLVFRGKVRPALDEAVAKIDAMPGDWKIVSISTPNTIYRDLTSFRHSVTNATRTPETVLLGRMKRLDLLA